MNNDIPDSAFPHQWDTASGVPMGVHGMTMRDYFAAQAMPALLAHILTMPSEAVSPWSAQANIAKQAYRMADAMLATRDHET